MIDDLLMGAPFLMCEIPGPATLVAIRMSALRPDFWIHCPTILSLSPWVSLEIGVTG